MGHAMIRKSVLLVALCLAGTYTSAGWCESMNERFDELAERYVREFPTLSPVSATMLGDHRYDDQLDDVSAEARDKEATLCRQYLKELGQIDRNQLSRASQVDFALLDHHLRATLWRLERLQEWAWNPLTYTRLSGGAVYGLLLRKRLQCIRKVDTQIFRRFDPGCNANEAVGDAQTLPRLRRQPGMGGQRRSSDERLDPTKARRRNRKLETGHGLFGGGHTSVQLEAEHSAAALEEAPGALVLRV